MNTHNLAIVFGPTLFQTDGQDYKAGKVVEDLISHYVVVFSVRPGWDWRLRKGRRGEGWARLSLSDGSDYLTLPRWTRRS